MRTIEEGKLYVIDGGFFKAHRNEEDGHLELWTYEGLSGSVIGRTGFEIDPEGNLYHRIFDFEAQEQVLFESGRTVDELEEIDEAELSDDAGW